MSGKSPFTLICGCETTRGLEPGSYRIFGTRPGSKCHARGDIITAKEAAHIRRVNEEWDRAEREYLEQR